MTGTVKTIARTATAKPARPSLLQRLVAWNAAYREARHVRGLDAHALRDVGMTDDQRDTITLRQIVSRSAG